MLTRERRSMKSYLVEAAYRLQAPSPRIRVNRVVTVGGHAVSCQPRRLPTRDTVTCWQPLNGAELVAGLS
jgi:hypothetical protein